MNDTIRLVTQRTEHGLFALIGPHVAADIVALAGQYRSRQMSDPVPSPVDAGVSTTAPGEGDDATINEMMGVLQYRGDAEELLRRIRAGKVPGIVDATVLSCEKGLLAGQYAEIAALRARVSELKKTLAAPVGADRFIDINGTVYTIKETLEIWQKELNESEARAHRIDDLEKERDQLRAEVAALHAENCKNLNLMDDLASMTAARDALAGRLADKESDHAHDRFQLDTWRRDAGNLKADLAAARAEVAALKARIDSFTHVLHAAKDTCESLVMPRMESQDVCGLRELRDAVRAAGVEVSND